MVEMIAVKLLPETKVYGGRLKSREELIASSSGGAFTAISDIFLKNGDIIICSSYNFDSHQQEYRIITTVEERNAARGSKYMQSIPGDIFYQAEEWLKNNSSGNLLFVGMGCQAAGFDSYAQMRGFRDRVILIDIICHGSASPQIWKEYTRSLEKKYGARIEGLTFKDKRRGWKTPIAVAVINGLEVSLRPYVKIFYNRKALRVSCHKCPYTTMERTSDITIGDFWHIEDKRPEQYDKMGTSLFIIHSDRGMDLFKKASISLDWFESDITECWQQNLEKPTAAAEDRNEFWQDYKAHGVDFIIQKYGTDRFIYKMKINIKKFIGCLLDEKDNILSGSWRGGGVKTNHPIGLSIPFYHDCVPDCKCAA